MKKILAIGAHPDDIELLCAGTLALLKQKGWEIVFATMTPGDCGSAELSREEISKIRKAEAASSAKLLDSNYYCMECRDIFILYSEESLLKVIKLIRETEPEVVITMSPQDYMIDHEITSDIVRTACFSAGIKNIETGKTNPFNKIPYLYYMDPMEGKDKFGTRINPSSIVDISSSMEIKETMLKCHASQRNWLMAHHGMDEYITSMKEFSAARGKEINTTYGEGFRQHLGHAFPQDDILKKELGSLVHVIKSKDKL